MCVTTRSFARPNFDSSLSLHLRAGNFGADRLRSSDHRKHADANGERVGIGLAEVTGKLRDLRKRGSDAKMAFAHWDFAVPEKPVLTEMAKFFNVGMSDAGDGTITHTLSTTLIGPDGKVLKFYPGNEWTPKQVVNDLKQSLGA